jgi:hypothetical protein
LQAHFRPYNALRAESRLDQATLFLPPALIPRDCTVTPSYEAPGGTGGGFGGVEGCIWSGMAMSCGPIGWCPPFLLRIRTRMTATTATAIAPKPIAAKASDPMVPLGF